MSNGRLLCWSKFESQHKIHEVKNCGKNYVTCLYLLKTYLYQFKRVNKTFFLKSFFNFESSNLIYVVICQGSKEKYIGETGYLVKELVNIYRQHTRQSPYQKLTVEEHLSTCGEGKFHMFPFLKILQENKSLRKYY